MPIVDLAGGQRIFYEVTDLTDPWVTPATVFLHHGLGKSSRWWLPWVRILARDFRVVTLDMLGCGRSSRPRGYEWSVADHSANALQVLDKLAIERVHFVGETVGGCVGMVMGATYPERIATMTLAACPFKPPSEWLLEQSRDIAEHGLAQSVERDLPSRLDWEHYPPEMYDWYFRQRMAASGRIVSEQYAAQAKEDLAWALPRIAAPTLLLIPDESPTSADRQMREMARVIPDARIADLPPGRRPVWFHFGQAAVCVAAFQRFIADVA